MQTNPAIGMAGSRLQRGEGSDTRGSSDGMDTWQQHTQQRLTLPSPSAMLTGALPPKHASSGPSSFHFSSHDSSHFSQHSYPHNTNIAENPHSNISSNENTSNSYILNEDSHLSTLERNPAAFIAAAGLMQISNDHSRPFHLSPTTATRAHHIYRYENHTSLSEVGASGLGEGVSEADGPSHVNSNSNNYPSIHISFAHSSPCLQNTPSSSYPSLRYTPMFTAPKPPPVPAPLPPSLLGFYNAHASGSKGKRKRLDNVLSHLLDKDSEREAVKLGWVKYQQKLAKDRKRWKQARRKSKIIILRVSSERLRALEDTWNANEVRRQSLLAQTDQSEDFVTTDLAPVKKTPKNERTALLSEKPASEASLSKSSPAWGEISDDEENTSEGGPDEGVGDEEYRGWGARQFSKKQQATMVPTKKSSRKVSRPKFFGETLMGSKEQGPSEGDGNEGYHDAGSEGIDGALFGDRQTPVPAPALSESELRRIAEEEEANKKLEEEKRVELERQREQEAEEVRNRAEEELERARKLAEQKAKEEARQRELEKERKRKEKVASAYRESKLLALKIATGEEALESWRNQEEEKEADENEEIPAEDLLPDRMRFAVVVDVEELLAREAYETFDAEFTAPSMDSCFSVDIPDLDIYMGTPPPMSMAPPPPPSKCKRRGRPRRHTARAPAGATTPISRSNVNPPPSTPTTTTTSNRKPPRQTGNDDGAFRWSSPRASRAHKKPIPPAHDSGTATQPRRKKGGHATTAGRRTYAAKLQSSGASAAKPVRTSSRTKKPFIQNYNFGSDDEKEQDISIPPEMYIDDDVDVPREFIDPIDLELDPDVGVLEREERRARLMQQKEVQRKRSVSAIAPGGTGDESRDEEPEVKIEEEYNTRWRRRTTKW
ncbi:hypothetical protein EV426DRAFT_180819 [Tirmania nivea]|nr:hypothetical protein EV426DRAFT_180819 [Tirmania nivea]